METRIAFTKRRLESLTPPLSGRVYYQDATTPGLNLCVTSKGAKSFYVVRKHQGRKVRLHLGGFPAVTVEQARKACQKAVAAMADGIDPQAAKQAARHEHTLQGLWDFWLIYAKGHKKSLSAKQDERYWLNYLKPWANRRLSSIQKGDVQALHAKVGQTFDRVVDGKKESVGGTYAANRLLALIKAMFNKADDIGFVGPNPAKGIKQFREEKRDRFLEGDELPKFFHALAAESNTSLRDFFLICLLTGARKTNVLSMAWTDVNLDNATWRIPDTKSGEPVVVALVAPAVAILEARHKANGSSPWVFPSRSASGHLEEPKGAWKRVCDRAGLAGIHVHDLRRSLGSWQAMGGSSLPVIGKSLGHSQVQTTAIYARLTLDPVRASVESATATMLQLGKATIDGAGMVIDASSEPATEREAIGK